MAEATVLSESPQSTDVEWKIRNFFDLSTEINYYLDSSHFSLFNARWRLQMHTNGETKYDSTGWIGLYLWKEESPAEHRVSFRIGIKNYNGSVLKGLKSTKDFPTKAHSWGKSKFLERSTLLKYKDTAVPNGTLTVFCSVRIADEGSSNTEAVFPPLSPAISTVESAAQTTSSDDVSPLAEDFKNIYINRRCTDVVLIVKNEEFHAHKTILVARSTVFASMFEHDLAEKCSGKVEIPDCDPSSFKHFLLFLYTGKLDDVSLAEAVDLYKTADKYDVKGVKEECIRIMLRDLCVDFFCDIISLAVMYGESDLLKYATNFFVDNVEIILPTTKWQQFLEENSSLCNELLVKLVKSKKLHEG